MQKYTDLVLGQNGQTLLPISGANVLVLTSPGGLPATIYSDNGVTVTNNPLTTDINGRYSFYAANGRYSLQISYLSLNYTLNDFPLEDDPATIGPGSFTTLTTSGLATLASLQLPGTTAHSLLVGQGSSPVTDIPPGAAGTHLVSQGPSADPAYVDFTGVLLNTQVFATAGTFTYTETPGTKFFVAEVVGAGSPGGGSLACTAGQNAMGRQGGGGAYAKYISSGSETGATVIVGAAGIPASGASGTAGGASSFGGIVSAPGGVLGGTPGTMTTPGFNGTSTPSSIATGGNLINTAGQVGSWGQVLALGIAVSCGGGSSHYGVGGTPVFVQGPGASGVGPGAGGSGALTFAGGGAQTGGAGTAGLVIVWEYM